MLYIVLFFVVCCYGATDYSVFQCDPGDSASKRSNGSGPKSLSVSCVVSAKLGAAHDPIFIEFDARSFLLAHGETDETATAAADGTTGSHYSAFVDLELARDTVQPLVGSILELYLPNQQEVSDDLAKSLRDLTEPSQIRAQLSPLVATGGWGTASRTLNVAPFEFLPQVYVLAVWPMGEPTTEDRPFEVTLTVNKVPTVENGQIVKAAGTMADRQQEVEQHVFHQFERRYLRYERPPFTESEIADSRQKHSHRKRADGGDEGNDEERDVVQFWVRFEQDHLAVPRSCAKQLRNVATFGSEVDGQPLVGSGAPSHGSDHCIGDWLKRVARAFPGVEFAECVAAELHALGGMQDCYEAAFDVGFTHAQQLPAGDAYGACSLMTGEEATNAWRCSGGCEYGAVAAYVEYVAEAMGVNRVHPKHKPSFVHKVMRLCNELPDTSDYPLCQRGVGRGLARLNWTDALIDNLELCSSFAETEKKDSKAHHFHVNKCNEGALREWVFRHTIGIVDASPKEQAEMMRSACSASDLLGLPGMGEVTYNMCLVELWARIAELSSMDVATASQVCDQFEARHADVEDGGQRAQCVAQVTQEARDAVERARDEARCAQFGEHMEHEDISTYFASELVLYAASPGSGRWRRLDSTRVEWWTHLLGRDGSGSAYLAKVTTTPEVIRRVANDDGHDTPIHLLAELQPNGARFGSMELLFVDTTESSEHRERALSRLLSFGVDLSTLGVIAQPGGSGGSGTASTLFAVGVTLFLFLAAVACVKFLSRRHARRGGGRDIPLTSSKQVGEP